MSSRELTPIPSAIEGIEEIREDNVTDKSLKQLLRRETELQLEIDAVQTEILQLEEKLGIKDGGVAEEGKYLDQQGPAHSAHVYSIDLEEFEAPEWCVPIKANVMTYDWEVKMKQL